MKICMIGTPFIGVPANKGKGVIEYVYYELSKALARDGYEVTYFSVKGEDENIKNLEVIRYKKDKANILLFNLFVFFKCLFRKYDIIFVHHSSCSFAGYMLKIFKRKPYLFYAGEHNPWIRPLGFLPSQLVYLGVRKSDKVVSVTQFIKDKIVERKKINPEKIEVIFSFVKLENFPKEFPVKKNKILFVSRMDPYKGAHLVLDAFIKLKDKYKDWELDFVGKESDKTYNEKLLNLVKENKLEKRVKFHGLVEEKDLLKFYKEANIFAVPSSEEAFGVVFVEALASYTPCIGFDVGGVPEIVSKDIGFLLKVNDLEGIKEKLDLLMKDKTLREKIGVNGRERVEELFSFDAFVKKHEELYNKILKR